MPKLLRDSVKIIVTRADKAAVWVVALVFERPDNVVVVLHGFYLFRPTWIEPPADLDGWLRNLTNAVNEELKLTASDGSQIEFLQLTPNVILTENDKLIQDLRMRLELAAETMAAEVGDSVVHEHMCRVCGCTDDHACMNAAGTPCHWVEEDLCSACLERGALPSDRHISLVPAYHGASHYMVYVHDEQVGIVHQCGPEEFFLPGEAGRFSWKDAVQMLLRPYVVEYVHKRTGEAHPTLTFPNQWKAQEKCQDLNRTGEFAATYKVKEAQ